MQFINEIFLWSSNLFHFAVYQRTPLSYKPKEVPVYKSFADALKARANEDKLIILASLDKSYVDMALNLYETSFVKFGINNFLFVCTQDEAVLQMKRHGIPCYMEYKVIFLMFLIEFLWNLQEKFQLPGSMLISFITSKR